MNFDQMMILKATSFLEGHGMTLKKKNKKKKKNLLKLLFDQNYYLINYTLNNNFKNHFIFLRTQE
jgi:hypothetical protein